jgi:hypothetical protein
VLGTSGTRGDDIDVMYAWAANVTGANVTVAEVDSGVDYSAPDLSGQFVNGWDYINGNNNPQDQFGHGTHVAGIIAALQNNGIGVSGVAPAAKVMPLRVLDQNGSGTDVDVAQAFDDAGADGVPIVNASLGSTAPSQAIEQAIAAHPNTLYVVAAGNEGTNNDAPGTPFYPCDAPEANVICVGASDQNDQPAYFSDYGASSVDLFAPGVSILSTYPTGTALPYAYDDGTSMATPMVSGTLALMLSHMPTLGATQLKNDLLASVDQAPQLAGLAVSGGELDAAAAVATAGGDAPYAPPGNRERPEVIGALTVGSTLTVNPGSWSRLPTSYAYQWQRCLLGVCLPIAGATGTSYSLGGSDNGATFDVTVTAGNAAGSAQATSAITATVGLPGAAPSSQPTATIPTLNAPSAPARSTPTPTHTIRAPAHPLRLSHVALVGKRSKALVFTLSGRGRVQVALARGGRNLLHLALSARRGQNRYSLIKLLRGRPLPPGRYVLTVRAGNRTVILKLTA